MAITPDGTTAYVTNGGSNLVSTIDLATGFTVESLMPTGADGGDSNGGNATGANTVHIYLTDPKTGAQIDTAKEVDVQMRGGDAVIDTVPTGSAVEVTIELDRGGDRGSGGADANQGI